MAGLRQHVLAQSTEHTPAQSLHPTANGLTDFANVVAFAFQQSTSSGLTPAET
jgi:hypothetical protein